MTKIIGNINHIGPSGGIAIQGDYNITAHRKGFIPPGQNDTADITVSGANLAVNICGPAAGDGKIIFKNKGTFAIGDAAKMGEETPSTFNVNSRQTIQIKAKDTIGLSVLNDAFDAVTQLSVGADLIHLQTYNSARPFANNSGIALVGDSVIEFTPTAQKILGDAAPGQLVARAASEEQGAGRLMYNTGSGIAPVAIASGIFYSVHNTAGGSGIPEFTEPNSPGVVPWTTDVVRDGNFLHDPTDAATNTHIWVTQEGLYKVIYTISCDTTIGTDRTSIRTRCKRNNTITVGGSQTWTYNRTALMGKNSASWTGYVRLDAGDTLSIDMTEVAGGPGGTFETMQGACSLNIEFIRSSYIYKNP